MYKLKVFLLLISSTFLFTSCGLIEDIFGSDSDSKDNKKDETSINYKEYFIQGKNLDKVVGFELFIPADNPKELKISKDSLPENWQVKTFNKEDGKKILAFNPELKPLKNSVSLFKVKVPEDKQINKNLSFKAVDDFGNLVKSAKFEVKEKQN
ncbi:MAG: hypothetical protein GXO21_06635 [Aquificae bacterium]|nr:hypothetical protein [Aquificota bacterium]